MHYNKYELNPFDIIQDKNFNKRELYHIDIHWKTQVPKGGKKYKLWVLIKPHVDYMVYLMGVMSTEELYKIKVAIEEGKVPPYFLHIVEEFYKTKQKGGFLLSIDLTELEIFDYTDHRKFSVPKEPVFKVKEAITVVPKVSPRIPTATTRQLQQIIGR